MERRRRFLPWTLRCEGTEYPLDREMRWSALYLVQRTRERSLSLSPEMQEPASAPSRLMRKTAPSPGRLMRRTSDIL
jgi:hypothetical protein